MLEAKEKEIDGIVFRYQPMMATPARKLFDELVQRFGPAVGNALGGLDGEPNEDGNLGSSTVMSALGMGVSDFSRALEPEFHTKLVNILGDQTEMKGEKGFSKFDKDSREITFGTKLATEIKWILFCLEVQYSDFLDLLRKATSGMIQVGAVGNLPPLN